MIITYCGQPQLEDKRGTLRLFFKYNFNFSIFLSSIFQIKVLTVDFASWHVHASVITIASTKDDTVLVANILFYFFSFIVNIHTFGRTVV